MIRPRNPTPHHPSPNQPPSSTTRTNSQGSLTQTRPSSAQQTFTAFSTSTPFTTITQDTTTLTSFSQTVVTVPVSALALSSSPQPTMTSPTGVAGQISTHPPICVGHGLDASAQGLLASVILPTAIGLVIWLVFALLRPRFRQVYGLREWFAPQESRPQPLGSSFFAFLKPHVPLVPPTPSDVSDAGRSAATDVQLFPSDEQLHQRALWMSFLIVLGWSFIGLAGALPLYLVATPCNAELPNVAPHGGAFSTIQDLSLLRLLRLFDSRNTKKSTVGLSLLHSRAAIGGPGDPQNVRLRLIILLVLAIVLGLLPALWKIIKEFNNLVAYRKRWIEVKCEGVELGWLSARKAPGFAGWGEKRLKDFILKAGLSSRLEHGESRNGNGSRSKHRRAKSRRVEEQPLNEAEEANLEVDIQTLFSIGDTQQLALLIDERDEILENLEIAETRYISSFRVTTPDPSIAEYLPQTLRDQNRPYISRPRPLGVAAQRSRRRRAVNPAFAASSLAPTSFVAPSQYYKLRGVQGVSGGRFADSGLENPSLTDSINSRVVGSRFQEVNRNSIAFGRLPIGSPLKVEKSGQLGPGEFARDFSLPSIPDPRLYGPNYAESSVDSVVDSHGVPYPTDSLGDEWVDLTKDAPLEYNSEENGASTAGPSFRRRPERDETPSSTRRETFPLRMKEYVLPDTVPPPHLRLQPSQPFVRPMEGLNYDDLGNVYANITHWRSRLKTINAEIADAQGDSYREIAEGTRIKGWIMVGRGLRFVPGIELIEGRAKEDIRWDVLQHERTWPDAVVLWTIVVIVAISLAAGLTAASGLALSTAPDVAQFLPFLRGLLSADLLASGLATVLAPAVASTLFICIALIVVHWATNIYGSVSISGGQLLVFKTVFVLMAVIAGVWLTTVGALLFALNAFSADSQKSETVANGAVYMSILVLATVLNVAVIYPGLLLLQPLHLWKVIRSERIAITPRQRFRAVYPRTYNPSLATGACVLAIVFASTFSLIFPLIGPAVVVLLFLTLIAHRFLIGYVYGRTHSQTGGLLQIWLLKRFGTLLSFQPFLLGLIFLSRRFWIEGGILMFAGVAVIIFVESYAHWKMKTPGRKSLSAITQDSLVSFQNAARATRKPGQEEEGTSLVSSGQFTRARGSMASVLEMMSVTLAVMPTPSQTRGPVPLKTETLDDLTATERAARTHPDAPPHLPPLPFSDHAEDMAGILYAPELIAPPPIIWLPRDSAGVARSEAIDLQKYHDLQVTLDVRAKEDVMTRRSSASRERNSR